MPKYVDGFVIPIAKKNLAAYRVMAKMGAKAWMKHGALQYFECVGDDLAPQFGALGFPKMAKLKPDETAIFAFITFKSKAHRDKVNKAVMKEMSADDNNDPKNMPFNFKRMAYGGFTVLVDA